MNKNDFTKEAEYLHPSRLHFSQEGREEKLASRKKPAIIINIILFLLTVGTTLLAGALQRGVNPLETPSAIVQGLPFSAALIFILLSHEMGHYIVSRIYHIDTTLPYFIPAPTFIGTFGAFIKMRTPVHDKKVLMDIGAAGPLAGLVVTIPILMIGLGFSELKMVDPSLEGGLSLGNSLILSFLTKLTWGDIPENYQIIIHPLGFAGWIGLLVTSLNLMPIGQLDGGHIAYAILGRRMEKISRIFLVVLVGLGIWGSRMWLFWALLLFFLLGTRHPSPKDVDSPLDTKRKILGVIMLIIFILTFVPVPFSGV